MAAHSASDSDPATHGDIDRLRVALRGDIDRLGVALRGDIDRAIHQQTWRILSLGVAIAAILAAILRLT